MLTILRLAIIALSAQAADIAFLDTYVRAIGGEAALTRVQTRVTEGRFDNGRGLHAPFRVLEKRPNKRVTIIGSHSIDADDGCTRWQVRRYCRRGPALCLAQRLTFQLLQPTPPSAS